MFCAALVEVQVIPIALLLELSLTVNGRAVNAKTSHSAYIVPSFWLYQLLKFVPVNISGAYIIQIISGGETLGNLKANIDPVVDSVFGAYPHRKTKGDRTIRTPVGVIRIALAFCTQRTKQHFFITDITQRIPRSQKGIWIIIEQADPKSDIGREAVIDVAGNEFEKVEIAL